ncbi:MAG TPA: hypothetical protein EYO07_06230 [Candidatus Marinimicrobia bacterium]|nr:hypothetical protein [Nitrososphaerota archaeon]HIA79739.1 hypothetical protein [Candidatus Neomarinimicrobiota bacterium]
MKVSEQLTYQFLMNLRKFISQLSISSQYHLAQWLASLGYHHIPKRKNLARRNLMRAFPNQSEGWIENTLKNSYQFFAYNFIQFLAFPGVWETAQYDIHGKDVLDEALKQKKGVVFISAHFGVWEMLGVWLGLNNYKLVGVAHRQRNQGANKFFQEQRELSGVKHIFRKEPLEKMYAILNENKLLGLVSDQDAKKKGVFIDFFGMPASTPKGAALFHKNTNAPMIFSVCVRTGFQKYQLEFLPIIAGDDTTEKITQAYTVILEKLIHAYPEQYFWFHRRWKTKPEKSN